MNRLEMIATLTARGDEPWDICIIGGGATGLGMAVDAASRGFSTLLLERSDFAKGTSSRSTKLVHGGVRYLQQGNIKLVTEALHERGILRRNAPHLVKDQSFIVPNYKWWEGPFYGIGLKVYDWMAGSLGLGPSRLLSREETLELAPTLDAEGLRGGVLYHDGQFDDARLAISLAHTAHREGATLLNYFGVDGLTKQDGKITGVRAFDSIASRHYEIKARSVLNCTGVFSDSLLQMDQPGNEPIIAPSQGVHIVLDKSFLPGEAAILVPHTDDGRVLFAVPWHDKIIVGTTDTPVTRIDAEPRAQEEEVDFILRQISRYLKKDPERKDIKSVFAGLRPLVKGSSKKTAELSRDHLIAVSASGMITVTGGKWTTYRRMAEDGINTAIAKAGLPDKPCITSTLPIHGAHTIEQGPQPPVDFHAPLYYYGTDADTIRQIAIDEPELAAPLHERLPYTRAEIAWAGRKELCMTVEDALSRRTRALLLDAKAAIECAPLTASLLAAELGRDSRWADEQTASFIELAQNYLA